MTKVIPFRIKCSCGNEIEMDIYESVNVTVDPDLIKKINNREINRFKCPKCGEESELAHHFLYADLRKKIWIWCFPESRRKDKEQIEKEYRELTQSWTSFMELKFKIAFGYDELEKLLQKEN